MSDTAPLTPDLVSRTPVVETNPQPEKVEFSPAQQAKLEEIIKDVSGRVAGDLRRQLVKTEAELAAAKAERDRAQAAVAPDAPADARLAVELDAERRKNAELTATMQRKEREDLIRSAARNAGYVSEQQALKLVDVPQDATPEQIQELVTEFGTQNPNLIRSHVVSGSGSAPGSFPPQPALRPEDFYGRSAKPGAAEQLNALSRSNPSAYRALRDAAKKSRLC